MNDVITKLERINLNVIELKILKIYTKMLIVAFEKWVFRKLWKGDRTIKGIPNTNKTMD